MADPLELKKPHDDLADLLKLEPDEELPGDTEAAPLPIECLRDLDILVRQEPEVQVIHLRALDKLREAPRALSTLSALCSDYGWEAIGGTDAVSCAAEIDEELSAMEAVTLPLLRLDVQDDSACKDRCTADQRKLMQPLLQQAKVIEKKALQLGAGLVSMVDPLVCFISHAYANPPITDTDINKVASLLEVVRNSSVRLDGVPESTLLLALDALSADVQNATYLFLEHISERFPEYMDIVVTKIRLHVRAIRNSAVRLDERVREEGLMGGKQKEEDEGGVDAAGGGSILNIADAFEAIRRSALRMDERLEQEKEEEEGDVLKSPNVGYLTKMDTRVVYDLKEIRLQLQAIRNSLEKEEQVSGEAKLQDEEAAVEADEKKEEE
jgi:hypothetical protein